VGQSGRYHITDDGLMLPVAARVLERPEDFRPGPGGQYLDDLARDYVRKLIKPVWYVLPENAGGPVSGSPETAGDRTFVARIGFSRQDRTELFIYGRMRAGASAELDHDVIPPGRVTEYGAQVWGWQVHGAQTDWNVEVYHDERGFF
jgi:hypothetical protein